MNEVVYPEALRCEDNGKRISQDVVDKIWYVGSSPVVCCCRLKVGYSEMNLFAMRLGKGKHLKGLTLMGGLITPEEFDHFHEVCQMLFCMRVRLTAEL